MPEILRPTNPVPGYDSAGSRNQPINPQDPNTNIQNVVDPNRVTRADQRGDQQQAGDASVSHRMRYESNFLTFLQRLANAPDTASAFLKHRRRWWRTSSFFNGLIQSFRVKKRIVILIHCC